MTIDLLLDAIERGAIDFDELLPECEQSWQYFNEGDHSQSINDLEAIALASTTSELTP